MGHGEPEAGSIAGSGTGLVTPGTLPSFLICKCMKNRKTNYHVNKCQLLLFAVNRKEFSLSICLSILFSVSLTFVPLPVQSNFIVSYSELSHLPFLKLEESSLLLLSHGQYVSQGTIPC